jgi:alcohol dehydrogenase
VTVAAPGPLPTGAPVVYEDGAVRRLPDLVADLGATRVLLVTGRRSFASSGAARMLPELERIAEVHRWSDFQPNTDADDLRRGLEILRATGPDAVIGLGGGSAMDMAKLLCAYADHGDDEALQAAIRAGAVGATRPTLILVPTTSGSGSEATHFAVVYIGDEKFSVAGELLRADAVVLDPSLTVSASAYQRATSGIDAVCQGIESLWAAGATAESREHANAALDALLPAIEAFTNDPTPAAASAMAVGSHRAGRAIDISRTTAAHALSYAITKRYGVSHGHAVALTLGHFVEAHAVAPPEALRPGRSPDAHAQAMGEVLKHLGASDGADGRVRFTALMERIGLQIRLRDVGVDSAAARGGLAAAVNVERLGNNPVVFDQDGLAGILERAA